MKKFGCGFVLGILMIGCALPAFALPEFLSNPMLSMSDGIRGTVGAAMTLWHKGDEPNIGAILNVTEEDVAALQAGDEAYVTEDPNEEKGTAAGDIPTLTYDFINRQVLKNKYWSPYGELNSKIQGGGNLSNVIKEMFFIEHEADNTEANRAKVQRRRDDYLRTLGREYTRLAYGVHEKLIKDVRGVSATLEGNGTIGTASGVDQTWKAVNRALIADIAMQIELLELDAARFLSVQPLVIMTKERPVATDSGS